VQKEGRTTLKARQVVGGIDIMAVLHFIRTISKAETVSGNIPTAYFDEHKPLCTAPPPGFPTSPTDVK